MTSTLCHQLPLKIPKKPFCYLICGISGPLEIQAAVISHCATCDDNLPFRITRPSEQLLICYVYGVYVNVRQNQHSLRAEVKWEINHFVSNLPEISYASCMLLPCCCLYLCNRLRSFFFFLLFNMIPSILMSYVLLYSTIWSTGVPLCFWWSVAIPESSIQNTTPHV